MTQSQLEDRVDELTHALEDLTEFFDQDGAGYTLDVIIEGEQVVAQATEILSEAVERALVTLYAEEPLEID
jgi:hypothetical protein